ncbi:MAG TPA: hypothetical protein VNU95_07220 [Candidatus Acidoferrales bacterium]|nr:hypothetical protein [Candidatus Acidoferrales bacterium]
MEIATASQKSTGAVWRVPMNRPLRAYTLPVQNRRTKEAMPEIARAKKTYFTIKLKVV